MSSVEPFEQFPQFSLDFDLLLSQLRKKIEKNYLGRDIIGNNVRIKLDFMLNVNQSLLADIHNLLIDVQKLIGYRVYQVETSFLFL
jgi:hypothetical protein